MRALVTGGAGFLGARLIQGLLDSKPLINGQQVTTISSLDVTPCPVVDDRVQSITGDISDSRIIDSALTEDTGAVCHLAAIVSSEAEADFDRGMRVNFDATRALLEACRRQASAPRFLFTSSLAVFGPNSIEPVGENAALMPQSSYGTQKAIGELLVADYSRRGFIDGITCRLPTIVIRPGKPNQAASSFASSIIREPLAGQDAICPVSSDQPLWLSSPDTAIANLVHALSLPSDHLSQSRALNLPGLTVSVTEMLDALERQAGSKAREKVRFETDSAIERIISSWPSEFNTENEIAMGFSGDKSFDAIINTFVKNYGK